MSGKTIRRFNRYELKYLVPLARVEAICADLEGLTTPDEHGDEHGYRIQSLYYDSPALDFFFAKIEGIKFRRKLRLRIYPDGAGGLCGPAMVEIKQRINRTVQKRRIALPLAEAERLCAGVCERPAADALDRQVADEVQYMVQAMNLRPTAITTYLRRAFVGGLYDAGLRITFDTSVAGRTRALQVTSAAENHLVLPPDFAIMEVKANEAIPDWVTSLLARHNCQIGRVSKYCAVVALEQHRELMALAMTPLPTGGNAWTSS